MLSPANHLAADELEDPGGMTWREVKEFLDHMRETCIKDRQELKLEVRHLRRALIEMGRIATERWDVACDLADALRFHEDRRINPTSRGGPALARFDALTDGCPDQKILKKLADADSDVR